ncbi:MAG: hypothetical protein M1835_004818 [Candelina submexicana]|nr:MAG: hypothetical protein M1835_004818 [Candelina submexicana]
MERPQLKQRDSLGPCDAIQNRFSAGRNYDPAIVALQFQREQFQRDSLASSKSSVSWSTLDFPPESRPPSLLSFTSYGSNASNFSNSNPNKVSMSSRSSVATPKLQSRQMSPVPPVFKRLPQEIYDCVLQHLRVVHLDPLSPSCATCYLRDLYSLALTSRLWDRAVRAQLYDTIWIVGNDSHLQQKKYKMKHGVRLKLLRRTLRERRVLGQYVRELKVPDLQRRDGLVSREGSEYLDLVASVVMACPNLERLVGFFPIYQHRFDRLRHALSTRRKLKEHVWIVGDNAGQMEKSRKELPFGGLQHEQGVAFLQYHEMWDSLHTLFLHSLSVGVLPHELFVGTFKRLPSLKHLYVSNFSADHFNDLTLQALPVLHSLHLQDLHGVTDDGLMRLASISSLHHLRRLSLINLEVRSLPVVSRLFWNLPDLVRFSLVQESSPELPVGGFAMQPVIASSSVEYIHWDVLVPGSANGNLAKSILAGGFPNLRKLRAPSDHHGVLQSVCIPRAQIALASDKYSFVQRQAVLPDKNRYMRNLSAARKAAQERIEEARTSVRFRILVDEDGILQEAYDINGFLGMIGSRIVYSLVPDLPGSDNAVIDVLDLLDSGKEAHVKDGCTGMWNNHHPVGKRWWSHTERYRYRPMDLQKFF